MRYVCIAAVLLAAGCGSSSPRLTGRPITRAEWKAVFSDWYAHGRDLHGHSCGAMVIAIAHLPVDPPMYSTIYADLTGYAAKVCTKHPRYDAVARGMSDEDVAALAGMPRRTGPRCWLYTERRVCFTNERASIVQRVVHG
jgi:hypothetical protein